MKDLFLLRDGWLVWNTVGLGVLIIVSHSAWWSWHRLCRIETDDGGRGESWIGAGVRLACLSLVLFVALWIAVAVALEVGSACGLDPHDSLAAEASCSITSGHLDNPYPEVERCLQERSART